MFIINYCFNVRLRILFIIGKRKAILFTEELYEKTTTDHTKHVKHYKQGKDSHCKTVVYQNSAMKRIRSKIVYDGFTDFRGADDFSLLTKAARHCWKAAKIIRIDSSGRSAKLTLNCRHILSNTVSK